MSGDIMVSKVFPTGETETNYCVFCSSHEDGDTLYDMGDWDGGIEFNYIRDIHYCPLCGKKLKEERLEL